MLAAIITLVSVVPVFFLKGSKKKIKMQDGSPTMVKPENK
jgi:hypothetical protein